MIHPSLYLLLWVCGLSPHQHGITLLGWFCLLFRSCHLTAPVYFCVVSSMFSSYWTVGFSGNAPPSLSTDTVFRCLPNNSGLDPQLEREGLVPTQRPSDPSAFIWRWPPTFHFNNRKEHGLVFWALQTLPKGTTGFSYSLPVLALYLVHSTRHSCGSLSSQCNLTSILVWRESKSPKPAP